MSKVLAVFTSLEDRGATVGGGLRNNVGVASKDQVNVSAKSLCKGIALVEQGDNNVGLSVGVIAVLEVGSNVVGDSNRIVEGQARHAVLGDDLSEWFR